MDTKLVICLGNEARGDDGVGCSVGRRLLASGAPPARVILAADLDVAMLEDVAFADVLVIVDAERREAPPVEVSPLEAKASSTPSGHAIDASDLLALAEALYAAEPRSYLLTVAAPEMGHGQELSPTASQAADEAVDRLAELLSD